MTNVIKFPTPPAPVRNALPIDFSEDAIFKIFTVNDKWLGWPEISAYDEHVEFFDDPKYPGVMLANISVPNGPQGLFYVDAEYRFQKISDELMDDGPIPSCLTG